jgi:hypothetical protein
VTTVNANFRGIRFTHLRLLRKDPFEPLGLRANSRLLAFFSFALGAGQDLPNTRGRVRFPKRKGRAPQHD